MSRNPGWRFCNSLYLSPEEPSALARCLPKVRTLKHRFRTRSTPVVGPNEALVSRVPASPGLGLMKSPSLVSVDRPEMPTAVRRSPAHRRRAARVFGLFRLGDGAAPGTGQLSGVVVGYPVHEAVHARLLRHRRRPGRSRTARRRRRSPLPAIPAALTP